MRDQDVVLSMERGKGMDHAKNGRSRAVDCEKHTWVPFSMDVYMREFPRVLEYIAHKACRRVQRPLSDGDRHYTIQKRTAERVMAMSPLGTTHVYAVMCVVRFFKAEAPRNPAMQELIECRARWCERLARALARIHGERDPVTLFTQVLVARFPRYRWEDGEHVDYLHGSLESALEVAVDAHSTYFLREAYVFECISNMWVGNVALSEECGRIPNYVYFATGAAMERAIQARHVVVSDVCKESIWDRLRTPQYQYGVGAVFNMVFLVVFGVVALRQRQEMTGIELVMWFLFLAQLADEARTVVSIRPRFYLSTMNAWVDVMTLCLLLFVLLLRLLFVSHVLSIDEEALLDPPQSLLLSRHLGQGDIADAAYNTMAFASILLWIRMLSVLASYSYFGNTFVIIRAMLKDSVRFFLLLGVVVMGFLQAFEMLQPTSFTATLDMLMRCLLGGADFAEASAYHPLLGGLLMMLFVFFAVLIMMNLLIAVFNEAYSRVVEEANAEYLLQLTLRTLVYMETPTRYSFQSPFNVVDWFVVRPVQKLLGHARGQAFRHAAWRFCMAPINLFIGFYELAAGPPKSLLEARYEANANLQGFGHMSPTRSDGGWTFGDGYLDNSAQPDSQSSPENGGVGESAPVPEGAPNAGDMPGALRRRRPCKRTRNEPIVEVKGVRRGRSRTELFSPRDSPDGTHSGDQAAASNEDFHVDEPAQSNLPYGKDVEDADDAEDGLGPCVNSDSDYESDVSEVETITSGDGLDKQALERIEDVEKMLIGIQRLLKQLNRRQLELGARSGPRRRR